MKEPPPGEGSPQYTIAALAAQPIIGITSAFQAEASALDRRLEELLRILG